MQKGTFLSSEEAAAHGAKLSGVDVVCSYPALFSAEVISGLKNLPLLMSDSFSSALNAAVGAEIGGKRAFSVASSPPVTEDIHAASYMRIPVVVSNISRPPGAFSIKHDHTDVMAIRDAGWLIFMPESNQEITDTIIQAYRVCEDPRVLLPGIVNIDIPRYSEVVQLPSEKFTRRYVPKFRLPFHTDKKKRYFGVPGQDYAVFRKQQHKAMENALDVVEKTSSVWKKKTKRSLDLVECYKMDDADCAIVVSGFHSTTAKAAADAMRKEGKKAGVLRIRVVRPWPSEQVEDALSGVKKIAVFDQGISLGYGGFLHSAVSKHTKASSFISLGNHPSEKDFIGMVSRVSKADREELVWL